MISALGGPIFRDGTCSVCGVGLQRRMSCRPSEILRFAQDHDVFATVKRRRRQGNLAWLNVPVAQLIPWCLAAGSTSNCAWRLPGADDSTEQRKERRDAGEYRCRDH